MIHKSNFYLIVDFETLSADVADRPLIWEMGAALVRGDGMFLGSWGRLINVQDMIDRGFNVTASTTGWLVGQSEEVRKRFIMASEARTPKLPEVLEEFESWVMKTAAITLPHKNLFICGRGADFDVPLLAMLYREVKRPLVAPFWNGFCLRTMEHVYPVKAEKKGIAHNAMDDATWEAECLSLQLLRHWAVQDLLSTEKNAKVREGYLAQIADLVKGDERTKGIRLQQDSDVPAPECLNTSCPDCHGRGVRQDGKPCIHMVSCPCPKCTGIGM